MPIQIGPARISNVASRPVPSVGAPRSWTTPSGHGEGEVVPASEVEHAPTINADGTATDHPLTGYPVSSDMPVFTVLPCLLAPPREGHHRRPPCRRPQIETHTRQTPAWLPHLPQPNHQGAPRVGRRPRKCRTRRSGSRRPSIGIGRSPRRAILPGQSTTCAAERTSGDAVEPKLQHEVRSPRRPMRLACRDCPGLGRGG